MEDQRRKTRLSVDVGRRMREIREAKKLKLKHVAEAIEMDQGALSRTERGQRWLSDDLAHKLADLYGVAPEAFYVTTREGEAATAAEIVIKLDQKRRKTAIKQLEALLDEKE